ncbi:sodium/potassium-transporting ATPase subunit beta-2-like isoform X1 [Zophobas morio]|uniref:sodium/potassium-transporting ATPase subunit beta-2-like isoform X1 n=1 Tax=Zophobas morio TaxID=2755281 RepID=UPI00308307CF
MGTAKRVAVSVLLSIYLSWASADQTQTIKSPVLELRPFTNEHGSKEIWVQGRSRETVQHWAGLLDDFLQPYRSQNASADSTIHQCGNNPPPENGVCEVDVSSFGPCNPQSHYGYTDSPCIFLRLNNVPNGWMPEFYNDSYIPEKMPYVLRHHIWKEKQKGNTNRVWVSCKGNYAPDAEFIGSVKYYPEQAFPSHYFGASGKKNFLSPLVAVHFERPRNGVVINVWCTAWAANIPYELGTINFDLMLDS